MRQVLAEQLAISRELTQKVKRMDSDEDEEYEKNEEYVGNMEDEEEEKDKILLLYRKEYDKKQQTEETKGKIERNGITNEITPEKEKETSCHDKNDTSANRSDMKSKLCSNEKSSTLQTNDTKSKLHDNEKSTLHANMNDNDNNTKSKSCNNEKNSSLLANTNNVKDKIRKRKKNKESFISDVDVTSEHNNKKCKSQDLNETVNSKKSKKKKSKLKIQEVEKKCTTNSKMEKDEENEDYSASLEFENPKRKPILDSPLEETTSKENAQKDSELASLKTIANSTIQKSTNIRQEVELEVEQDVDLKKYPKPQHLKTQLPDLTTAGDDDSEQEEETHKIMTEAFADDDADEEFRKEKEEEVRKNFK